jgi:hypothetical protein
MAYKDTNVGHERYHILFIYLTAEKFIGRLSFVFSPYPPFPSAARAKRLRRTGVTVGGKNMHA